MSKIEVRCPNCNSEDFTPVGCQSSDDFYSGHFAQVECYDCGHEFTAHKDPVTWSRFFFK